MQVCLVALSILLLFSFRYAVVGRIRNDKDCIINNWGYTYIPEYIKLVMETSIGNFTGRIKQSEQYEYDFLPVFSQDMSLFHLCVR